MAEIENKQNKTHRPKRSKISFNQDDTLIHIYELKKRMYTNNMKEQDIKTKQVIEDKKVIESIRKKNIELENERIKNVQIKKEQEDAQIKKEKEDAQIKKVESLIK